MTAGPAAVTARFWCPTCRTFVEPEDVRWTMTAIQVHGWFQDSLEQARHQVLPPGVLA